MVKYVQIKFVAPIVMVKYIQIKFVAPITNPHVLAKLLPNLNPFDLMGTVLSEFPDHPQVFR